MVKVVVKVLVVVAVVVIVVVDDGDGNGGTCCPEGQLSSYSSLEELQVTGRKYGQN